MNKLNFSDLINSEIFKIAVKGTSFLYNMFYISLIILVVLIIVLGIVNNFDIYLLFKILGRTLLACGIILSCIFGYLYLSKIYTNYIIGINKEYIQNVITMLSDYFCKVLFTESICTLLVGVILNIFTVKMKLNRR